MKKTELLNHYRNWTTDYPPSVFACPFSNLDLAESDREVVNRLFYLVHSFAGSSLQISVFYADNIFQKDENGDLLLVSTDFSILF